jgi:hypothetical protein
VAIIISVRADTPSFVQAGERIVREFSPSWGAHGGIARDAHRADFCERLGIARAPRLSVPGPPAESSAWAPKRSIKWTGHESLTLGGWFAPKSTPSKPSRHVNWWLGAIH